LLPIEDEQDEDDDQPELGSEAKLSDPADELSIEFPPTDGQLSVGESPRNRVLQPDRIEGQF